MTATASPRPLHVLSGGAAQGLVTQLEARFKAGFQIDIDGAFGAVGMMKDSLLAGTPCDVVILSDALIAELSAGGYLLRGTEKKLGVVKTGVAVKAGEKAVDVSTPSALTAALREARGIYFPDPVKATAGIHVMKMIRQLGLEAELGSRLRPFPNGAAAMKAMAESPEAGLVGCTQITEILYADGVDLVAALPKEFELATVYTAAVSVRSAQPEVARRLIDLLIAGDAETVRRACGFEA